MTLSTFPQHNKDCKCEEHVQEIIKVKGYHNVMIWLEYHMRRLVRDRNKRRKPH